MMIYKHWTLLFMSLGGEFHTNMNGVDSLVEATLGNFLCCPQQNCVQSNNKQCTRGKDSDATVETLLFCANPDGKIDERGLCQSETLCELTLSAN